MMRKLTKIIASLAISGLAMGPVPWTSARAQENPSPLTVGSGDTSVHIFPTSYYRKLWIVTG